MSKHGAIPKPAAVLAAAALVSANAFDANPTSARNVSASIVEVESSRVPAPQQAWRTSTMSRRYDGGGAEPVRVEVNYGGGTLALSPAPSGVLYEMEIRYDESRAEPVAEVGGGWVELGLESLGGGMFNLGNTLDENRLDLGLGIGVPMDLKVNFGVGSAEVDLGGLSLTGLSVETGASQTRLEVSEANRLEMDRADFAVGAADFSASGLGNLRAERVSVEAGVGQVVLGLGGPWRDDSSLSVEMGVGALTLMVPEGLGLRVDREGFLTTFDSEGLIKRGDSYYSPDWESATRRLHVELDTAFGKVAVSWYDPVGGG